MTRSLTLAVYLSILAAPGLAQDDPCGGIPLANPPLVEAFDNTSATTAGTPGTCPDAEADLWWALVFLGGRDEIYTVRTCNLTSMDSVLYAYDWDGKGCPNPTLIETACNDDACDGAPQSSIFINPHFHFFHLPVAYVRLGNFPGSGGGSGQIEFLIGDPDCPGFSNDALDLPWPNGNVLCVNANVLGAGNYPSLAVHKGDQDFYAIPLQDQDILTANVLFTHANGDLDIRLDDACGGTQLGISQSSSDDEQIVYHNTTGGALTVYLEVYVRSDSARNCNDYEMNLEVVPGGVGTKYCTTNSNSTGSPADLSGSGTASSSAGDLTLDSSPVPNQTGIFFHGSNTVQVPFGNGFLCASGGLKRGSVVGASLNTATYTYDNSNNSRSLSNHIGQTRNFQHWFRDPMGGGAQFNLSNGLSLTILP